MIEIQLLGGNEQIRTENLAFLVQRIHLMGVSIGNLRKSVELQQRYYNKKQRDVKSNARGLMLLLIRSVSSNYKAAKASPSDIGFGTKSQ